MYAAGVEQQEQIALTSVEAGLIARQAVADGDAKTLRKYLQASLDGKCSGMSRVVDGENAW